MRSFTIKFRIAAWYFISSATVLAIFAISSWFAMRTSILHSTDRDLKYRLDQVIPYVQAHSLHTPQQYKQAFGVSTDASVVGVFVQVTSSDSDIVYESDILKGHNVTNFGFGPVDGSVTLRTIGDTRKWPVRVASQRIQVSGTSVAVHLVEPLRDTFTALREYTLDLCGLVLAALLLITTGGYFLSNKALAPVERIRQEAEAIDPNHLTSRLPVPHVDDELKRLAETLNAMLARIEGGFVTIQQFTADASHELRAPLALIITAAEVTLRRERSTAEFQETLRRITVEARRMSKTIEDLLLLARGDTDYVAETELVDIQSTVQEVCDEFAPIASAKQLTLSLTLSTDSVGVKAPGTDVRRVLVIMLDNAIKYTESGSISVSVACEQERVELSVSDTGIGISSEDIPLIFDRFWRADRARSRGAGGAGLGLSLATQITARLEGEIKVTSQFGKGSRFTLTFPIRPEVSLVRRQSASSEGPSTKQITAGDDS
jgi:heavy metal sensor kinase